MISTTSTPTKTPAMMMEGNDSWPSPTETTTSSTPSLSPSSVVLLVASPTTSLLKNHLDDHTTKTSLQKQVNEMSDKEDQIRHCLHPSSPLRDADTNNNAPTTIDLWELRHLALTRGGLLSKKWRQRAWPKLVGAYQGLYMTTSVHQTLHHPTKEDIQDIKQLVNTTQRVWKATTNTDDKDEDISPRHRASRRVSFELPGEEEEELPPTAETTSAFSTKEERQVLRKVLIHLKRMHPEVSLEDSGLPARIAVLLANLNHAPSHTSLVLQQLVRYHWNQPNDRQFTVFQYLLQVWDPLLSHHLTATIQDDNTELYFTSSSWITNWFAKDIPNLGILSRLWDAFLVSHPSCPIYFSVALLVHFRSDLLSATSPESLVKTLTRLPSQLLVDEESVEQVLAACLQAMRPWPPPVLSSFSSPPAWFLADTALTDLAIVQRCQELQASTTTTTTTITDAKTTTITRALLLVEEETHDKDTNMGASCKYPLAAMAAGMPIPSSANKSKSQRSSFLKRLLLMSSLLLMVLVAGALLRPASAGMDTIELPISVPKDASWNKDTTTSSRMELSKTLLTTIMSMKASSDALFRELPDLAKTIWQDLPNVTALLSTTASRALDWPVLAKRTWHDLLPSNLTTSASIMSTTSNMLREDLPNTLRELQAGTIIITTAKLFQEDLPNWTKRVWRDLPKLARSVTTPSLMRDFPKLIFDRTNHSYYAKKREPAYDQEVARSFATSLVENVTKESGNSCVSYGIPSSEEQTTSKKEENISMRKGTTTWPDHPPIVDKTPSPRSGVSSEESEAATARLVEEEEKEVQNRTALYLEIVEYAKHGKHRPETNPTAIVSESRAVKESTTLYQQQEGEKQREEIGDEKAKEEHAENELGEEYFSVTETGREDTSHDESTTLSVAATINPSPDIRQPPDEDDPYKIGLDAQAKSRSDVARLAQEAEEQASEAAKKARETVSRFLETPDMPASIPQDTDEFEEPAPLEMKEKLAAGDTAVENEPVGQESAAEATQDPKSEVLQNDKLKEDLVPSSVEASNEEASEEEVANNHVDDIAGETQEEYEIGVDARSSGMEETSSDDDSTSREVPGKVFSEESVTQPTLSDVEAVLKGNEELLKHLHRKLEEARAEMLATKSPEENNRGKPLKNIADNVGKLWKNVRSSRNPLKNIADNVGKLWKKVRSSHTSMSAGARRKEREEQKKKRKLEG